LFKRFNLKTRTEAGKMIYFGSGAISSSPLWPVDAPYQRGKYNNE